MRIADLIQKLEKCNPECEAFVLDPTGEPFEIMYVDPIVFDDGEDEAETVGYVLQ